jgi:hypothetical protein
VILDINNMSEFERQLNQIHHSKKRKRRSFKRILGEVPVIRDPKVKQGMYILNAYGQLNKFKTESKRYI